MKTSIKDLVIELHTRKRNLFLSFVQKNQQNITIVNKLFKKSSSSWVTYESVPSKTQIGYCLVRTNQRKFWKDINILLSEEYDFRRYREIIPRHKEIWWRNGDVTNGRQLSVSHVKKGEIRKNECMGRLKVFLRQIFAWELTMFLININKIKWLWVLTLNFNCWSWSLHINSTPGFDPVQLLV